MFVKDWTESILHPAIAAVVLGDIYRRLTPEDQPYFRQTREAMFKCSIEEIDAGRPQALETFHATLKPLYRLFSNQSFVAGEAPNWADHIVFGALQWARLASSTVLLPEADPILAWMGRVLSAYGLKD